MTNTAALLFPDTTLTPAVRIGAIFAVIVTALAPFKEKLLRELNKAIVSNSVIYPFLKLFIMLCHINMLPHRYRNAHTYPEILHTDAYWFCCMPDNQTQAFPYRLPYVLQKHQYGALSTA